MEADFNFFLFKGSDLSDIVIVSIQKVGILKFGFQFSHQNNTQEQGIILISLQETSPITMSHIFSKLSPYKNILIIDLSNLGLNDQSIKIIREAKLDKIMQAYLSGNTISHVGVTHLVQSRWDGLQILYLNQNPIKNKGLRQLAKSNWPRLIFINLSCTSITDDGIQCLIKAQWPQLKTIVIQKNHLSNESFKKIVASSFLKLKGIVLELEKINDMQEIDEQQRKTYFNHNIASKIHPSWKQTYFMANFQNASKNFKQMIKYKNDKLFNQDEESLSDEDEP